MTSQRQAYHCAVIVMASLMPLLALAIIKQPSEETLQQLKVIEDSMNRTADPCEDFYAYACGNWSKNHPYYTTTSMYSLLLYKYLRSINEMMSEKYPHFDEVKRHNQSFADKLRILQVNSGSLNYTETSFFEVVKPGKNLEWPLINDLQGKQHQHFEQFDVFAFLGTMFSYGLNNVIIGQFMRRHSNGTLHILLGKPETTKFGESQTNQLLAKIGYPYDRNTYDKICKEVQVTHELWQSLHSNFSARSKDFMTYAQMRSMYPQMATFLENMIPQQIKSEDFVEIANVDYMEYLMAKQWQPEEIRKLCNYMMARFDAYMTLQLNDESVLRKHMHLAVNFLYYQHNILPEEQQYNEAFNDLQQKIFKHLLEIIDENNLKFTDNLIAAIKEKLNRLHITRGNLPDNVNFAMVDEFYRDIPDFEIDNRQINYLKVFKHRVLEAINCPKHMECMADVGPTTGNIPQDDLLIVPFASFTPPMYHWHFDPLLSISLLGSLLAHEYTHSMDTTSLSSPDVYETLHEDFLNHPELGEAEQCMQDQHPSKHIRERVADFMGVRTAYRAYSKEYNIQPQFTKTPWKQLFFLNMAQYFCQDKYAKAIDHDPSDLRLRQIAMNMEEFAEAFQCPVGSKMNPEKKCRFY